MSTKNLIAFFLILVFNFFGSLASSATVDVQVQGKTPYHSALGTSLNPLDLATEGNVEGVKTRLQQQSGVLFSGGDLGGSSYMFLRGADASKVAVTLDGLKMNDPSQPSRSFDWAGIGFQGFGNVRLLKGSESLNYGSDAMAGAVDIRSAQISKKDVIKQKVQVGSFDSRMYLFENHFGMDKKTRVLLNFTHFKTNGYDLLGQANGDSDGYYQNQFVAKATHDTGSGSQHSLFLLNSESEKELDDFEAGTVVDDINYIEKRNRLATVWKFSHLSDSGAVRTETLLGHQSLKRWNINEADEQRSVTLNEYYLGAVTQAALKSHIYLSSDYRVDIGADWISEVAEIPSFTEKKSQNDVGLFASLKYIFSTGHSLLGARWVQNNLFGNYFVYQYRQWHETPIGAFWGSVGTAFKTPSFSNLYYPNYGNPLLKPENSLSAELGWQKKWHDWMISTQLFQTQYRDLISSNSLFIAENIGRAQMSGVEAGVELNTLNQTIKLSASYWDSQDLSKHTRLVKRPYHLGKFVHQFFIGNWTQVFQVQYVGQRYDFMDKNLDPFFVTDWSLEKKFSGELNAFVSVNNVFNKRYETSFGYPQARLSAYMGVQYLMQ